MLPKHSCNFAIMCSSVIYRLGKYGGNLSSVSFIPIFKFFNNIFISNMSQDKIDQAIRSRSMMIDLSMTTNQKIDRMEFISKSDEFLPEYDADVKSDALALIRSIKDDVKEISLRTLIAVSKVRASNKDWKDLATYMLTA